MKRLGINTLSVQGGEEKKKPFHSLTNPIVQTSTYTFIDTAELIEYKEGRLKIYEYGRYGNPTQEVAEKKLALLENGEKALMFSSGMNAITTFLFTYLKQGDHLIITNEAYKRTRIFCRDTLPKFGIEVDIVPPSEDYIEKAIKKNTKIILSESPTNPHLNVLDLEKISAFAKKRNIMTAIDSTFASPYNVRPLELGIDIVIHSLTKYIAGHNDVISGAVIGKQDLLLPIEDMRSNLGGTPSPTDCYYIIRGLKTFALRTAKLNDNGMKVAEFLETHPKIERVFYPGLKCHSKFEIAKKQMKGGFGGVVSFLLKADRKQTSKFIDSMKLPYIGPSLGGVEGLIIQPAIMTYYDVSVEERLKYNITDNLVRYSLGIEDIEDIIDDLKQALDKI